MKDDAKQINKIKNILVIKLSSIGDCLLATPAVQSIRKGYPESFITWLIEDKSKDIALQNPWVDEVIVVDKKNFGILDYFRLFRRLRKRHYDISIDLQGVDRTSLFAYLSGAKERYVEEFANLGFLSNRKISREGRKPEHAVDFYLFLAQNSGGEKLREIGTFMHTTPEDKAFAVNFISDNFGILRTADHGAGETGGGTELFCDGKEVPFVGINPSGAWKTKRWPTKYFIELSKNLIEAFDARIVIFGGKGDEYFAEEIIKGAKSNNIKSAAGKTTLKQARELLGVMDYFVTPDSGLMHIAAGIGRLTTIALFGATDPALTGPYGVNAIVLKDNLSCMPCFEKECPLNKMDKNEMKECVLCMKRITPSTVFNLIAGNLRYHNACYKNYKNCKGNLIC